MSALFESGSAFCRPAIHRQKFLHAIGGLGVAAALGECLELAASGRAVSVPSASARLQPFRVETTGREFLQLPEGSCCLCVGCTRDGRIFPLSANTLVLRDKWNRSGSDVRGEGWAGMNFSADGRRLFAMLMMLGNPFAITGV